MLKLETFLRVHKFVAEHLEFDSEDGRIVVLGHDNYESLHIPNYPNFPNGVTLGVFVKDVLVLAKMLGMEDAVEQWAVWGTDDIRYVYGLVYDGVAYHSLHTRPLAEVKNVEE